MNWYINIKYINNYWILVSVGTNWYPHLARFHSDPGGSPASLLVLELDTDTRNLASKRHIRRLRPCLSRMAIFASGKAMSCELWVLLCRDGLSKANRFLCSNPSGFLRKPVQSSSQFPKNTPTLCCAVPEIWCSDWKLQASHRGWPVATVFFIWPFAHRQTYLLVVMFETLCICTYIYICMYVSRNPIMSRIWHSSWLIWWQIPSMNLVGPESPAFFITFQTHETLSVDRMSTPCRPDHWWIQDSEDSQSHRDHIDHLSWFETFWNNLKRCMGKIDGVCLADLWGNKYHHIGSQLKCLPSRPDSSRDFRRSKVPWVWPKCSMPGNRTALTALSWNIDALISFIRTWWYSGIQARMEKYGKIGYHTINIYQLKPRHGQQGWGSNG